MTVSWFARNRARSVRLLTVASGLYGLTLLAGPFLHHDLACHLKSRTHCTTCAFNLSASGIEGESGLRAADLPEADWLLSSVVRTPAAPVATETQDRSPPA